MRHRMMTSHFGGWVDPSDCFVALSRGEEPLFWLDSGTEAAAGMSCMGLGSRVVTCSDGFIRGDVSEAIGQESIFEFLRREQDSGVSGNDDGMGFPLGWVGWLGYELHESTLHTELGRASRFPDAAFLFADRTIVFDHASRTVTLVALGDSWSGELGEWKAETIRMLAALRTDGARDGNDLPEALVEPEQPGQPVWAYTDSE